MVKRRIRTTDQLPRALSREAKIAKKKDELAERFVGVDLGSGVSMTGVALVEQGPDGIRRLLGMEVIENPNLDPDSMYLLNQRDVAEAVKEALRSYDFRKRHDA
jgi:hypothetical protein